jgi:hypothetical protein
MTTDDTAPAPAQEIDHAAPAVDPQPKEPPVAPLPVRTGDVVEFVPRAAKAREADLSKCATYLLRVPSRSERGAYQRDLISRGAVSPDYATISISLRRGLKEILAGEELLEALALADEFDATLTTGTFDEVQVERFQKYKDLERKVIRAYAPFAALYADQFFWLQLAPVVAIQHALVGWRNVDGAFETERGRVTERALDVVEDLDYLEVASEALGLFNLNRRTRKN